MAFAQKRDTVCPGQKLTQLEGPLLADCVEKPLFADD